MNRKSFLLSLVAIASAPMSLIKSKPKVVGLGVKSYPMKQTSNKRTNGVWVKTSPSGAYEGTYVLKNDEWVKVS